MIYNMPEYWLMKKAEPIGPCLTFSSPSSFTLKVNNATKHWEGTLEYSTDASTWSTWNGTNTLSSATSGSDNVLYLRGTGNTVITGEPQDWDNPETKWVLTGSNIACSGNIETLLNYATVQAGSHPTMASYCYLGMFCNCTGLTTAPALPATTLTLNCYTYIFRGCTNLTTAPALPAMVLANNCYYGMFYGCSSIKLSNTKTEEYTLAYRIPTSGKGTDAKNVFTNMFYGSGGTFKGSPIINATYYLHSSNSIVG